MESVELLGYSASFFGLLSFFPQVIKTWKTKNARDLSLSMFIIFFLGVACWLAYGLLTKNSPLVFNYSIMLVFASIMLAFKIKYS